MGILATNEKTLLLSAILLVLLALTQILLFKGWCPPSAALASQSVPAEYVIVVFAWKRFASLKRLCTSLLSAHYYGKAVDLAFFVDGDASQKVVDYVIDFSWPHGSVNRTFRAARVGLEENIMTSWIPRSPEEKGIFLEDDIQVSPFFFKWIIANEPLLNGTFRRQVYGISLYTPRVNEIVPGRGVWLPDQLMPNKSSFLLQVPCSWGSAVSGYHWTRFLRYYRYRKQHAMDVLLLPSSNSEKWSRSWKKYLIEWMLLKGLTMLYPNFKDQESFSTNFAEPGEHTGPDGSPQSPNENGMNLRLNPLYLVPLVQGDFEIQSEDIQDLPIWDMYHEPVRSHFELVTRGLQRYEELLYINRGFIPIEEGSCVLDSFHSLSKEETTVDSPRYLAYLPSGGYSNQMRSFEDALAISKILNRTLIVPQLQSSADGALIGIREVFNLTDFESDAYTPLHFGIDLSSHNASRAVSFIGLTKFSFGKSPANGASSKIRIPSVGRLDYDIFRWFGGCRDQILSFDNLFTAFQGFSNKIDADGYTGSLSHLWRLNNQLNDTVSTVQKKLNSFGCVHIRRQDFQEYCLLLDEESRSQNARFWLKDFSLDACYPSLETVSSRIEGELKTHPIIDSIYVATDDPLVAASLKSMLQAPNVVSREMFNGVSEKYLPFLEQSLCVKADFFLGNIYSTFSQWIAKRRASGNLYIGR